MSYRSYSRGPSKSDYLVVFGFIAALIFFVFAKSVGFIESYSEGERVGVITKFSKKGIIFKSWEGSINQGGTKTVSDGDGGHNTVANSVSFNSSDPEVIRSIKYAADSGYRVKITYSQWLIKPLTISNSRVVTSVKILN